MKKKKFKNKSQFFLLLILILAFFLRFYKLSSNPPSLYWEEVALGYDAYSLLKTGKDHRGNPWPIVYIESYMDYKPPFYVYVAIPSVWLFGLNEFSVRLPSAFFGTLTVLVVYFLTKEVFKFSIGQLDNVKLRGNNLALRNWTIGLIASFLLAISPWHLQFSRAAFEANLALFLTTTGILFFLKSFKRKTFLLLAAIFFGLSLYTYHGARIFTPLILLVLSFVFFKKLWQIKKIVIFSLVLGLILLFPLVSSLWTKGVQQRFQETSVFATLDPILESNKKIQEDGGGKIARLVHHRFWEYSRLFFGQYFRHFNGSYLFLYGDENPRHSTQEFGQLYHWELASLILGLVFIFKNFKKKNLIFILGWLLIASVPGAITKASPHALRTIFALPPFVVISSLGLIQLIKVVKNNKILLFALCSLLFSEFILYFHFYFSHYPKIYSQHWQYGYKQVISFARENKDKYDNIWLTNAYGRNYMYFLFFQKTEPSLAQEEIELHKYQPEIPKIGKFYFDANFPLAGKNLYIVVPGEMRPEDKKLLKTIDFLNKERAFEIWETK